MCSPVLRLLLIMTLSWKITESLPSTKFEKIVGGKETTIEKHPFQASLQYLYEDGTIHHWCGASILSNKFLLTTAHCVPSNADDMALLYARVGSASYDEGGQLVKIQTFTIHPKYFKLTLDYDFAIASFQEGVELYFGPNIQPVTLAGADQNPNSNELVTVSGWGLTDEHDKTSTPKNLKEVKLPIWTNFKCKFIYIFLTPRQICIGGFLTGGQGSCFGDSGSPAIQNGVQYGLVTGGNSCWIPLIPGIYGRVSTVRSWIKNVSDV